MGEGGGSEINQRLLAHLPLPSSARLRTQGCENLYEAMRVQTLQTSYLVTTYLRTTAWQQNCIIHRSASHWPWECNPAAQQFASNASCAGKITHRGMPHHRLRSLAIAAGATQKAPNTVGQGNFCSTNKSLARRRALGTADGKTVWLGGHSSPFQQAYPQAVEKNSIDDKGSF